MAEKKRQRAPRKTPDFDHVVAVTTRLLQEKGDQRLRIEDVMAETGIAKSSLYAKFGDRDGLVAAALAKQFQEIVAESLEGLRFALDRSSSPTELQRMFGMVLKMTLTSQRDTQRMTRIAVLANTIGEPICRISGSMVVALRLMYGNNSAATGGLDLSQSNNPMR